jgi:hypothetical protein
MQGTCVEVIVYFAILASIALAMYVSTTDAFGDNMNVSLAGKITLGFILVGIVLMIMMLCDLYSFA